MSQVRMKSLQFLASIAGFLLLSISLASLLFPQIFQSQIFEKFSLHLVGMDPIASVTIIAAIIVLYILPHWFFGLLLTLFTMMLFLKSPDSNIVRLVFLSSMILMVHPYYLLKQGGKLFITFFSYALMMAISLFFLTQSLPLSEIQISKEVLTINLGITGFLAVFLAIAAGQNLLAMLLGVFMVGFATLAGQMNAFILALFTVLYCWSQTSRIIRKPVPSFQPIQRRRDSIARRKGRYLPRPR